MSSTQGTHKEREKKKQADEERCTNELTERMLVLE
jgi:hypothetical protein